MPTCNSCGQSFPDYKSLAMHITTSKKGHRRSKLWAAKYNALNSLSYTARNGKKLERTPLTEEDKEAKVSCFRDLSGQTEAVKVMCIKCKEVHHQVLPVEYTRSPDAWRNGSIFFRLCNFHGGQA